MIIIAHLLPSHRITTPPAHIHQASSGGIFLGVGDDVYEDVNEKPIPSAPSPITASSSGSGASSGSGKVSATLRQHEPRALTFNRKLTTGTNQRTGTFRTGSTADDLGARFEKIESDRKSANRDFFFKVVRPTLARVARALLGHIATLCKPRMQTFGILY